jgi:hypothetical protein
VLEYTWHEKSVAGVARWDLADTNGATRLVLDHRALPPTAVASIGAGWHTHLEWLASELAGDEFDFWPRYRELKPVYADAAAAL